VDRIAQVPESSGRNAGEYSPAGVGNALIPVENRLIRHGTENPRVGSSILSLGTNSNNRLRDSDRVRPDRYSPYIPRIGNIRASSE